MTNKAIFLDRDGVLNRDHVNYSYRLEEFEILPRVPEALAALKAAGFVLVIITNQSGIAKGLYTKKEVMACYEYLQKKCNNVIDGHYYAPYHPSYTESLSRKPDSLMIERAMAKFAINPQLSWLIGDKERDILAGVKQGVKGILIEGQSAGQDLHREGKKTEAVRTASDLWEASQWILHKP